MPRRPISVRMSRRARARVVMPASTSLRVCWRGCRRRGRGGRRRADGRARRRPATDRAVLDRLGVRRRGIGSDPAAAEHQCLEVGLQAPVVGGVVGDPEAVPLAVAGDDVDLLGLDALDAGDALGVGAHLEDGGRLHRPGELGVGDLVGPVAEPARASHPREEVGVARPPTVEEDGLVDDVGALFASRRRFPRRGHRGRRGCASRPRS